MEFCLFGPARGHLYVLAKEVEIGLCKSLVLFVYYTYAQGTLTEIIY